MASKKTHLRRIRRGIESQAKQQKMNLKYNCEF